MSTRSLKKVKKVLHGEDKKSLPDRCGGRKHWLVQAMGHGFGSWIEGSHGFADVK